MLDVERKVLKDMITGSSMDEEFYVGELENWVKTACYECQLVNVFWEGNKGHQKVKTVVEIVVHQLSLLLETDYKDDPLGPLFHFSSI